MDNLDSVIVVLHLKFYHERDAHKLNTVKNHTKYHREDNVHVQSKSGMF